MNTVTLITLNAVTLNTMKAVTLITVNAVKLIASMLEQIWGTLNKTLTERKQKDQKCLEVQSLLLLILHTASEKENTPNMTRL